MRCAICRVTTLTLLLACAWTTDKDGTILALLVAEITAHKESDLGEIYHKLTVEVGEPLYV